MPLASKLLQTVSCAGADALVSGVENLAAPLYAEAVKFLDDAIAGVAPGADTPVTADSQADAAAGSAVSEAPPEAG